MTFFPSTVTLKPAASVDAHHKVTYGTSSTPSCRYAKKDQVIQDNGNNDILTIAWVQFPLGISVSKNDQIVLPDGTTGPVVFTQLIHYPHTGGEMCIEVFLGGESI